MSFPKSPVVIAHCGIMLDHIQRSPNLFSTKISTNKVAFVEEKFLVKC